MHFDTSINMYYVILITLFILITNHQSAVKARGKYCDEHPTRIFCIFGK
jgi:hypothetical protein